MPNPLHEVIAQRNVMVPMRDGVRLSADIYLPARDGEPLPGKHPALLHRTQYDKSIIERSIGWCTWFAQRGYVAIIQDSRGTFESEGLTNFFIPEAEDGFDTLEWIGQQPWSNEEVGNWGISWAAWTQTAMAALGPPYMGPLVPTFGGSNAYTSTVRQGGAFELRLMGAAFWVSAFNKNLGLKQEPFIDSALNRSPIRLTDWLKRLPIRRGQTQLALVPNYENWVFEIMTRSDYDEYWKHPSFAPAEYWEDFPDKPMLFVGGWYDPYTRAVFENFTGLSALKKGPIRVLVGPWTHANDSPERVYAGDVEFGADAAVDFKDTHLRWFDQWMRGVENGVREEAPIRLFVMGGGGGHRTLGRPDHARRPVARRTRVAAGADEVHSVLHPLRRFAGLRRTIGARVEHHLHIRPRRSRPDHRRTAFGLLRVDRFTTRNSRPIGVAAPVTGSGDRRRRWLRPGRGPALLRVLAAVSATRFYAATYSSSRPNLLRKTWRSLGRSR